MPNWKKVIVSGSNAALNQLTTSGQASILDGGLTVNSAPATSTTTLEVEGDITASGYVSASTFYGDGSNLTGISTGEIDASSIDHDLLNNFEVNEHINHTSVTLTAGNGLTGGGDISANRTFTVNPHTGVTVDGNGVSIGQDVATTANVQFSSVEAQYRKLDITSATIGDYNGDVVFFGGEGTGFEQHHIHYYNNVNWVRASEANAPSSKGLLAIAIGTQASDGMLIRGFYTLNGDVGSQGDILYLRTNGDFGPTPPSTSGNYSRVVGHLIDGANPNRIYFNPSPDWIEIE